MANFNKVLMIGNLTRDPQLSYLPTQTAVVDFGIASNRKWTGKDGSAKESVCFIDCRAFGPQAETINKYLSKGKNVFIEGRLDFDSWTSQDGKKLSKHRITVESFQFLGAPGQKSKEQPRNADDSAQEPPPADTNDDIPF